MSNDLHNLEEVPEFTEDEKEKLVSILEARSVTSSVGVLMPKLSYRFRFSLTNFGYSNSFEITRNAVSCDTPDQVIDNNGNRIYSDFSVCIRNDIANIVQKEIDDQLKKQLNGDMFDCSLDILDGSTNNAPLEKRVCTDCKIVGVKYSKVDYGATDTQVITLIIRPTTFTILVI